MFKDFLFNRKMAYQMRLGHEVTVTDFAALLGVNQGDLSHWLRGNREPKSNDTIRKLADNPLVGPGIYSALGIIRLPDALLDRVVTNMEKLPPAIREKYAQEIEQAAKEVTETIKNYNYASV